MLSWMGKLASALWLPLSLYARMNKDDTLGDDKDPLLWCKDLEKHTFGEFSFAVVQANEILEDYSQVEVGRNATFIGVYDGHGGPEASRYVCDHLFPHLIRESSFSLFHFYMVLFVEILLIKVHGTPVFWAFSILSRVVLYSFTTCMVCMISCTLIRHHGDS